MIYIPRYLELVDNFENGQVKLIAVVEDTSDENMYFFLDGMSAIAALCVNKSANNFQDFHLLATSNYGSSIEKHYAVDLYRRSVTIEDSPMVEMIDSYIGAEAEFSSDNPEIANKSHAIIGESANTLQISVNGETVDVDLNSLIRFTKSPVPNWGVEIVES